MSQDKSNTSGTTIAATTTYRDLGAKIERALVAEPSISVVSFDVFDTLVVRRCTRAAVIQYALRQLGSELARRGIEAGPETELAAMRSAVISDLAAAAGDAGRDPEFLIDDLYPELLRRIAGDALDQPDLEVLAKQLVDGEVAAEVRACVTIDASLAAVRDLHERGVRMIVTSDMYLGSAHLMEFLDALGYRGMFADIFVSGDGTGYKVTGNAFKHVMERLQVTAAEILHIGDNESADIEAAGALSIATIQIVDAKLDGARMAELADHPTDEVGQAFALNRWTDTPTVLNGRSADSQAFAESYGYTAVGPIFAGFLHRTVVQAIEDGIDVLYFLSRDGYAPMVLYEAVAAAGLLPPGAPKSRYLAVSRLPTMRSLVGGETTKTAIVSARNQLVPGERTIRNTLRSLGMDADSFFGLARNYGLAFDEEFGEHTLHSPAFASFLASEPVAQNANEVGEAARALLGDYFEQEGVFSAGRVGLVDIGWGGTIQEQLFLALGDRLQTSELFGYYLGGNISLFDRHEPDNQFAPLLGSVYTPHGGMLLGNSTVWASVALLEEAARAPHGTCRGYERIDGQVVPIVKADDDRPAEVAGEPSLAGLQRGMVEYALRFFDGVDFLQVSPFATRRLALLGMQRLVLSPDRDELAFWRRLTHTNDIGGLFDIREQLLPSVDETPRAPRRILANVRGSMWTQGAARQMLGPVGGALYNAYWALSYARKRQSDLNNYDHHGYDLEDLFWGTGGSAGSSAALECSDDRRAEPRRPIDARFWVDGRPTPTDALYAASFERTELLDDGVVGTAKPLFSWSVLSNLLVTLGTASAVPKRVTRGVVISNDSIPIGRFVRRRMSDIAAPALVRSSGLPTHRFAQSPRRLLRRLLRC